MTKKNVLIGLSSFLIVLFTMPLGHALMILLEHMFDKSSLYNVAFAIGAVGLLLTIVGIFVNGDTRQTLFGLCGGLLFWTGWIEFGFAYYANRFGVQPLTDINGEVITKPEYLIMPSSAGFFVMFLLIYLFSIKSGCNFFIYMQKLLFRNSKTRIELKPMARHTALVTFMELNLMMWASYLLLLFCYDDHFLGDRHPVTTAIAVICLFGAIYMFTRLIRRGTWSSAIRYAIATVIVFWTFVEVLGRRDVFKEIWVHPLEHKYEMTIMFAAFVVLVVCLVLKSDRRNKTTQ